MVPSALRFSVCLVLAVAHAAELPPGVFVDIDAANTTALAGAPSSFFTDDANDPGFRSGSLWRRRAGFGFNIVGNRDVYEKDANGGFGDAVPLMTTVVGLRPGYTYPVYVAFLSVASESWRIRAGLAPDALALFTPGQPVGRVTDLGLSAERDSNRHQYLGFVGDATAGSDGVLRLYLDDGDGATRTGVERTWVDGFLLGAPQPPPLPVGSVSIAPDGAWTWFNDERAIVHGGALYAGYVRADGQYGVTRRDLVTGAASHMTLSTATSAQKDDHNNASLTVLPDGRLLALYSKHIAGNRYFQRSSLVASPVSDADWGAEIVRPTPAANTYANTFRLSGEHDRIYNFHRCLNFNPTLTISDDLGVTWGAPRPFIGAGTGRTRPYTRFTSNHRDRIDVIYTDGHPRDVNNSLYHIYYQQEAFHRTDGTTVKALADLPLEHDAGERGSVIYSYRDESWGAGDGPDDWIPTGRAWNWDVACDNKGHPVVAFQVQRDKVAGPSWSDDRIYYYYARWTGSEWQRRFIAHAGRPLYAAEDDYAGGMALDPTDPRVVYISSNAADPFALDDTINVPLRADARYELWRGVTEDGGLTFTWTQLTIDSRADNLRPIVPENHGLTECLLWFHGTYRSYTDYNAQVLGRIGSPVPKPTIIAAPAPVTAPAIPATQAETVASPATEIAPVPSATSSGEPRSPVMRNPVRR